MSIVYEIVNHNPWWKNKNAIRHDKHLLTLKRSNIEWKPRIRFKLNLNKDTIYTLRGPRQVGKTTFLKMLIRDLLNDGIEPRRIFYYTCDLVESPNALVNTVNAYLEDYRPKKKDRTYLFLDEVSSIKDWQRAIKYLFDTGKLSNTSIILTGSHSLDIKKAYEKLPGRRGILDDVPDKILVPMKFVEYVETRNDELASAIDKIGILHTVDRRNVVNEIFEGRIPEKIRDLWLYNKELEKLFHDYLTTGGIPKALDDYVKTGHLTEGLYRTYIDIVLGDLTRWNKKANYLRQILRRVIEAKGNAVGWNTLKQGTDVASHNTVADYVDSLEDSFVLYYLKFCDIGRGSPIYQKDKKIHFYDPFFFHAVRGWISGIDPFAASQEFLSNEENVGMLTESVVGNHLIRLAFNYSSQKQLFEYENVLFYWRSGKGREVDFIIKLASNLMAAVEVKYSEQVNKDDLQGIIDFKKTGQKTSGLILSKGAMEVRGGIVILPIWIFLMLI